MRGERDRIGFVLVGGPRRLADQQLRALDRGGDVGQPVGERLERADGHAELLSLLGVLHPELERGAGESHQRTGSEHAPLVDRPLVQHVRVVTARRAPCASRCAATGRRARHAPRSWARAAPSASPSTTASSSPSRPTTTVATAPPGTRRTRPSEPGWSASTATGGCSSARRASTPCPATPLAANRRAATHPSTSGTGASAAPARSAASSRSRSAAPPPPCSTATPIAGPPSARHRAPEVGVEAACRLGVADDGRRALLDEEHAERLDELLLLVGQREVHGQRQRAAGVNVAGMRCQPPTIAQSG